MPRLWWRSWCRCGGGAKVVVFYVVAAGVMFRGGGVEMTKVVSVVWWSRRCCWRQCNSGAGVPRWRQRWCSGDVAAAVTGDGGESGMVVEMKTKCDVEVVVVRWRWGCERVTAGVGR
ncbi:hypothetical protein Tco_1551311 [Tanacetum coccineum]